MKKVIIEPKLRKIDKAAAQKQVNVYKKITDVYKLNGKTQIENVYEVCFSGFLYVKRDPYFWKGIVTAERIKSETAKTLLLTGDFKLFEPYRLRTEQDYLKENKYFLFDVETMIKFSKKAKLPLIIIK